MSYKHGVYTTEAPTSIVPAVLSDSIPVVFGTAPVNMSARDKAPVNEPVLCNSFAEAAAAFGYSDDWSFTLCEFMRSHFALFAAAPAILINVLDPSTHKKSETGVSATLVNDVAMIDHQGVLLDSVVVKSSDGVKTYVLDTDYSLAFDNDGNLVIQRIESGDITAGETLQIDFDKLDPSAVDANDIIGGVDGSGNVTGLELLNQIFPRFRVVPGMVLAPGFSQDPTVAAVMTAKSGNINGHFKAIALTDVPADKVYAEVPSWKENNNYTSERQAVCYPKLTLGDKKFHMSTQLAGVLCATDAANDGVPYVSPSNQNFQADGAALDDGTPVFLGPDQAAYLNGNGIVTALNFIGGWKAWGNRTGTYPSNTDPKDSFIAVRRMLDWIQNTIVLTYWQLLDSPITRRLVEATTDSMNLWLNGLASRGYILGGRIEFNQSDNPETDLMDGIIRFNVSVTPPSPARAIEFVVEYDAQYLSGLFAA